MGGFRDLLAWLLAWKASRSLGEYYRVAAGHVHSCGSQQRLGRAAGQIHTSGTVAGQIDG